MLHTNTCFAAAAPGDDGIIARQACEKGGFVVDFQPMSPEEMQRMMQFLLNQQAQFAADFSRVDATLEKLLVKTDSIAEGVIGLTRIVGLIGGQVGDLAGQVGGLAGQVGGLAGRVGDLATAQQRTDEHLRTVETHLNVVIEMFERHLREDHGHQRPS
jgi:hypothetical protein